MPRPLPPGLYERLVSRGLDRELRELDPERFDVHKERPVPSELPRLLAGYVHRELLRVLESQGGDPEAARRLALCQQILQELTRATPDLTEDDHLAEPASLLTAVVPKRDLARPTPTRPTIPLGSGDLLVNARGEPSLARTLASIGVPWVAGRSRPRARRPDLARWLSCV
jgi:hypothetical protein